MELGEKGDDAEERDVVGLRGVGMYVLPEVPSPVASLLDRVLGVVGHDELDRPDGAVERLDASRDESSARVGRSTDGLRLLGNGDREVPRLSLDGVGVAERLLVPRFDDPRLEVLPLEVLPLERPVEDRPDELLLDEPRLDGLELREPLPDDDELLPDDPRLEGLDELERPEDDELLLPLLPLPPLGADIAVGEWRVPLAPFWPFFRLPASASGGCAISAPSRTEPTTRIRCLRTMASSPVKSL